MYPTGFSYLTREQISQTCTRAMDCKWITLRIHVYHKMGICIQWLKCSHYNQSKGSNILTLASIGFRIHDDSYTYDMRVIIQFNGRLVGSWSFRKHQQFSWLVGFRCMLVIGVQVEQRPSRIGSLGVITNFSTSCHVKMGLPIVN